MSAFGFNLALSSGTQSSAGKYQRALLDAQAQQNQAAIQEIDSQVATLEQTQRSIAETQNMLIQANTDAAARLGEATETLGDQYAALNEAWNGLNETVAKQTDAIRSIEDFRRAFADRLAELFFNEGTAGGWVGAGGATGLPFPTGTLMLTHNNAPNGWIVCTGGYVSIDLYAQLFAVIGHRYDAEPLDGRFRLPSKSDLTSDAAVLSNDRLRFLMRV